MRLPAARPQVGTATLQLSELHRRAAAEAGQNGLWKGWVQIIDCQTGIRHNISRTFQVCSNTVSSGLGMHLPSAFVWRLLSRAGPLSG